MQKEIQTLKRAAQIVPSTINAENRTANVIFSTGVEGLQRNIFGESYLESLSLEPDSVRLERLNNGAPLLIDHNQYSINGVIGVVESARVNGEEGTATVRFSSRPEVDPIFRDVQEGILRNLSVGYRVYEYERTQQESGPDRLRAVDWEPLEISLVPIGFDDGAKVRVEQKSNKVEIRETEKQTLEPEMKGEQKMEFEPLIGKRYAGESLSVEEHKFVDAELAKRAAADLNEDAANEKYKDGLELGRKRVLEIQTQCRKAGLEENDAIEIAKSCTTTEEANAEIVNRYVEKSRKQTPEITSHIMVQESKDHPGYIDAVSNALLNRTNPVKFELTDDGRLFRGMSIMDIVKSNLDKNGITHRGMTVTEILGRGMLTSSDFPQILENVANKILREAYVQTPQTFRPLVSETSVMDFKPVTRVQIGDAPKLLKVNEHGEFTHGTMVEGHESLKLNTFGRLLSMSRPMVINDDLGAFARVANSWGRSASELESEVVWNLITSNPIMSDGKNVFHADHGNLQVQNATKGKLDLNTLSDARRVMRLKKSLEGKRLNLSAQYLVVSSLYETAAEKLLTPVIPNKNEDVNIFANRFQIIVESLLDDYNDKSWFLVAPPSVIDGIEIAYLDGERGVQLERQDGFSIDGVQFKARLDFGAAFIDHRGWFKNEGV